MLPLLLLLACRPAPSGTDPGSTGWEGEPPVAEAGDSVVALVGETVPLTGEGSVGVDFTWTFGDGATANGNTPDTEHSWQAPGHYTASLSAVGEDGRSVTDWIPVTITWPLAAVPPQASAPLQALGAHHLVAVLPDHDLLVRVHRETHALATLGTCREPRSVAVGPTHLAVACTDDQVSWYTTDFSGLGAVDLPRGSRPFGAVFDPQGQLWVTLQGTGELALVDPDGLQGTVPLGPDLRGLASTAQGLLASRHRSSELYGEVWRVLDGQIASWSLARDPGPDSDTDARGIPTYLERIAVRPDGRVAAIGGLKANTGRGEVTDGLALTHETTTRAVLRQVALDPGEGPVGLELTEPHFDDRDRVSAMAWHPRGDWLFVAHHGSQMIDVVDSYTMDRINTYPAVGHGVDGLWVDAEARVLWALASLSRELVAYDLTDLVGPPVELARVPLADGLPEPLGDQGLLGKQVFHNASDPRMTATGYMSCASCHLDGDHDGRTWDFTDRGEGLRNTISLLGSGALDHGPLHWSGNFDEIQDFEGDIRGPMGGDGFLALGDWVATQNTLGVPKAGKSEELDAMAHWLSTLIEVPPSPYRTADGELTAQAQSGEVLFNSLATGCAGCHPAPTYTDSALIDGDPVLHDVGTLTFESGERLGQELVGLDTPSLRGLHATAPYLHDGRHDTVRALLEDNPGDLHGVTSHLAPNELDSLEAFLLSIE